MKILITGGLGFVGTKLTRFLLNQGHHVTVLDLPSNPDVPPFENFRYICADTTREGKWQEELKHMDAAVNLAGATIFKRWNDRYKTVIYESRILTTRNLVQSIPENKPFTLCSTSAVGFYGNRGDDLLTETEPGGDDFLSQISKAWEAEACKASKKGARVVISRFGIVLGKSGGALKQMIPAFKWFVGGPLGDGMQWFPWIHVDDLVRAILFVLETKAIEGAVNFCSPNPVQNRTLAGTLGRVLKRPAWMPAPAFLIRLVLGEFASAVLASQRAIPDMLITHGFTFQYSELEPAIRTIIEK